MPVVMGEAANNNDGLGTVRTSLLVSDGSSPSPIPPDSSSYSQQTKVTLDGCKQAYERFKAEHGEPLWRVLGNEGLKGLREQNEKEGVAQTKRVDLFHYDTMYVPKMHHAKSGRGHWIDEVEQVPWSWKAMIARMSETDKKTFAEHGIIDFWFGCKDEIDHLRTKEFRQKNYTATPMVWDFYIKTGDDKTYNFHPNWSGKVVRMNEVGKSTPPPNGFEKLRHNLNRQYPLKGSAELTDEEKKMIAEKKKEKKKEKGKRKV